MYNTFTNVMAHRNTMEGNWSRNRTMACVVKN